MNVTVVTLDGKSVSVSVPPEATMADIAEKAGLEIWSGVSMDGVTALANEQLVADSGITADCQLREVMREAPWAFRVHTIDAKDDDSSHSGGSTCGLHRADIEDLKYPQPGDLVENMRNPNVGYRMIGVTRIRKGRDGELYFGNCCRTVFDDEYGSAGCLGICASTLSRNFDLPFQAAYSHGQGHDVAVHIHNLDLEKVSKGERTWTVPIKAARPWCLSECEFYYDPVVLREKHAEYQGGTGKVYAVIGQVIEGKVVVEFEFMEMVDKEHIMDYRPIFTREEVASLKRPRSE